MFQMSAEELEQYVNQQFDELNRLVRLEEWRVLHLVDLKEAFLTAQASEKITEISVHTEKLQEEMDSITQQLSELDQVEQDGVAPMSLAPMLAARPPRPPEPMPLVSHFYLYSAFLNAHYFKVALQKKMLVIFRKEVEFFTFIHFPDAFMLRHISLVHALPGNQTHNVGVARAMAYCLSYRNARTSHILVRAIFDSLCN